MKVCADAPLYWRRCPPVLDYSGIESSHLLLEARHPVAQLGQAVPRSVVVLGRVLTQRLRRGFQRGKARLPKAELEPLLPGAFDVAQLLIEQHACDFPTDPALPWREAAGLAPPVDLGSRPDARALHGGVVRLTQDTLAEEGLDAVP